MWRLRLRVGSLMLLGFALAALILSPLGINATPTELQAAAGAVPVPSFSARILRLGGCPTGTWYIQNTNTQKLYNLEVNQSTQFINATCSEFQTNEVVTVTANRPDDRPTPTATEPGLLIATSIRRTASPSVAPINIVDFRGTLLQGFPLNNPHYGNWIFDTNVGGKIMVKVTEATEVIYPADIAGPTVGRQANVRAQSQNGGEWTAIKVEFIQTTSTINFTGLIEVYPSFNTSAPNYIGYWRIGGRGVYVLRPSIVEGTPKLYRRATVQAKLIPGNQLEAEKITIDEANALGESFTLSGRVNFIPRIPEDPRTPWKIGCIPAFLDPNTMLPPNVIAWQVLSTRSVQVTGSRGLGVGATMTTTKVTPLTVNLDQNYVDFTAYVDRRTGVGNMIELQIAGVTVEVSANQVSNDITDGAVVQIVGQCVSDSPVRVRATQAVALVDRPLVRFQGQIIQVENETTAAQAGLYVIKSLSGEGTQRIRAYIPAGSNRYEPVVGNCLDGSGFQLSDGTIDAKTVNVDRCAPSPLLQDLPTPTPTQSNFENNEPGLPRFGIVVTPAATPGAPSTTPLNTEMSPSPARPSHTNEGR